MNRNSSKDFFKKSSFENVDSRPKILLIRTYHLENSTTKLILSTLVLQIKKFYLFFQLGNRKAYEAFQEGGEEGLKEYIYSKMWNPEYR
jgi:hypothetical protein